ncbi:hypothetical protein QQF64_010734 [Cirrhinus molitorella]|uniref:Uncharacterized protein n=1 Tax=Cirrhinus molitorella TaxID=172907 RepID=A0ABR3LY60_9TELE
MLELLTFLKVIIDNWHRPSDLILSQCAAAAFLPHIRVSPPQRRLVAVIAALCVSALAVGGTSRGEGTEHSEIGQI